MTPVILGRNKNAVMETFVELEEQIKKAGLPINQDKTKYMCVSRSRHNERNTPDVGGCRFE